jgi:50S ribosomal subunit-associated GTPase HflX
LETKPRLLVFNKCDALQSEPVHPPGALCVSARTGAGIGELKQALEKV